MCVRAKMGFGVCLNMILLKRKKCVGIVCVVDFVYVDVCELK